MIDANKLEEWLLTMAQSAFWKGGESYDEKVHIEMAARSKAFHEVRNYILNKKDENKKEEFEFVDTAKKVTINKI